MLKFILFLFFSNDLAFTLEGYILVLLSDVFTAANGVVMKQKLVSNVFGTFGLMYYNSIFVLLPASVLAWSMGDFELVCIFNRSIGHINIKYINYYFKVVLLKVFKLSVNCIIYRSYHLSPSVCS